MGRGLEHLVRCAPEHHLNSDLHADLGPCRPEQQPCRVDCSSTLPTILLLSYACRCQRDVNGTVVRATSDGQRLHHEAARIS
jgi:hypothetical protein